MASARYCGRRSPRRDAPSPKSHHQPARGSGAASTLSRVTRRAYEIPDGTADRDKGKNTPEASSVVLGAVCSVPLVYASIHVVVIMRQPQLRHEARESDKQRRVRQTLPTKSGCNGPRTKRSRKQTTRTHGSATLSRPTTVSRSTRPVVPSANRSFYAHTRSGQMNTTLDEQPNRIEHSVRRHGPRRELGADVGRSLTLVPVLGGVSVRRLYAVTPRRPKKRLLFGLRLGSGRQP